MRARSTLLLMFLVLCPLAVRAQTSAILSTSGRATVPPGVTRVPVSQGLNKEDGGKTVKYWSPTSGQIVIPRYANGTFHPAGGLEGSGAGSVIQANAKTEALPEAVRALVITEDYDKTIRQFQGQRADDKAGSPVMQPFIRDVTLVGRDVKGDDFWSSGDVSDSGNPGIDKYNAILWRASGGLVENVNIFGFPGSAGVFTRGCCPVDKTGPLRPFDNEKFKLWNINVGRCNRGIDIWVVDAVIGNYSAAWVKEFGLKFSAGATQIAGAIHTWGGEKGVWFPKGAGGCQGGPLYCEQGDYPLYIGSSANDLGPIFAHSGAKAAIFIAGTSNTLKQARVVPGLGQPVGVWFVDQYNTLADSTVIASAGGKGIYATFAGGSGMRVVNTRVSGGKDSTLIDLTGTASDRGMSGAVIHVELSGSGATGLDLVRDDSSSVLRGNNTITITTPTWPDPQGGLTKVVDLPAGWQSTTPRKTTNVVTINGVRWYPPRDE